MTDAEIDGLLEKLGDGSPKCRALIGIIRHLRGVIAELKAENEELRRSGGRPAAPFAIPKEKRVRQPKKPGRKPGHQGAHRLPPQTVDEHIEVPLDACPHCHGPVTNTRPIEQIIEEIPPCQCRVIRLVTHTGRCPQCGTVRSTHPLQVSTATGAAGTHLGPHATAIAASLLHQEGLPKRKAARILENLTGLRVSPGALSHLSHRIARKLEHHYQALRHRIATAPVVYADETSWYVGQPGATLWAFANQQATLYCVRDSRARAVIHDILGTAFQGVLVSDCLSVYDEASPIQHKCYAHHLRAVSEMAEKAPKTASFCRQTKALLRRAMLIKTLKPSVPPKQFATARANLSQEAQRLFGPPRADPDEEHLANRFRKQLDHLFTFLDYEGVDATNNLAERQLRPAVISRKLSCGNRTPAGAATWEILASLAATCAQTAQSFIQLVANTVSLSPATIPTR